MEQKQFERNCRISDDAGVYQCICADEDSAVFAEDKDGTLHYSHLFVLSQHLSIDETAYSW